MIATSTVAMSLLTGTDINAWGHCTAAKCGYMALLMDAIAILISEHADIDDLQPDHSRQREEIAEMDWLIDDIA